MLMQQIQTLHIGTHVVHDSAKLGHDVLNQVSRHMWTTLPTSVKPIKQLSHVLIIQQMSFHSSSYKQPDAASAILPFTMSSVSEWRFIRAVGCSVFLFGNRTPTKAQTQIRTAHFVRSGAPITQKQIYLDETRVYNGMQGHALLFACSLGSIPHLPWPGCK